MKNPVSKVAAIHDLSSYGRASLTVVMPILSTMGIQACPLPTAVLSTHSGFSDYYFTDLTDHMKGVIKHWQKLNLTFDAIYSGFLGSNAQIDLVLEVINRFKSDDSIAVVDPVMGDNGKLYGPLNQGLVNEMKRLVQAADIITPNITEAALLLDEPYREDLTVCEIKDWLCRLAELGPDKVVITSAPSKDKKTTSVVAYNKIDNRFWKVQCDYIPAYYPGTGDAFTSVIVGSLLQGDSLPIALDRAVQFTSLGIRSTFGYQLSPLNGFLLEKVLDTLKAPVQLSSYQLLD